MTGDPKRLSTPSKQETPNIRNFSTGHRGLLGQLLLDKKRITPRWAGDWTRTLEARSHLGGFCEAETPGHPVRRRRVQGQRADEALRKTRKPAPNGTGKKS